jgi:cytidylate kinase
MIDNLYSVRSPDALVRAIVNRKRRDVMTAGELAPPLPVQPAFTIALSREAGTRASLVAHEIGVRLGWPVFDRELLERIAQDMGLRTSLLDAVDERHVSWIEETIEAFGSALAVSETGYVIQLIRTVLSLGAHGDCVIVGRGSPHVLPPTTTLRVRLIAALKDRTRAMSETLRMDLPDAERHLNEIDGARARFVNDHFHKDVADPHNYDLLISMSRFTVSDCATLIIEALERIKASTDASKQMSDERSHE